MVELVLKLLAQRLEAERRRARERARRLAGAAVLLWLATAVALVALLLLLAALYLWLAGLMAPWQAALLTAAPAALAALGLALTACRCAGPRRAQTASPGGGTPSGGGAELMVAALLAGLAMGRGFGKRKDED